MVSRHTGRPFASGDVEHLAVIDRPQLAGRLDPHPALAC